MTPAEPAGGPFARPFAGSVSFRAEDFRLRCPSTANTGKLREMLAARLNRGNDDDGKSAGDTPDETVEA
ncbi:MAG: hypothetical protein KA158_01490, partial [Leucobacter sp.]|nr:hypothetical protein [Leucobacter sp.]